VNGRYFSGDLPDWQPQPFNRHELYSLLPVIPPYFVSKPKKVMQVVQGDEWENYTISQAKTSKNLKKMFHKTKHSCSIIIKVHL